MEKICGEATGKLLSFQDLSSALGDFTLEARIAQLEKKFEEMEKKMPMETKAAVPRNIKKEASSRARHVKKRNYNRYSTSKVFPPMTLATTQYDMEGV